MADARARFILTAEDRASKALRGVDSKLGALQKSATGVGRAFGLLAGGGLAAFAAKSIQSADQIGKLSTRLGISTEALSQYKFVAQQTGVEFNTLTTGLQRMVRRISEAADETGPAKDALMELGLSAKELEQLQPDQQFELLADAMARVENQGDKVRLAMRLFDTEGVSLLQTMEGGAVAISALREEADRLGLTLDEHVAKTAAEASDAMGRLGATGQALSVSLATSLGPTLADIANWLAGTLPEAIEDAKRAFRGLTFILKDVDASLADFAASAKSVLAKGADFVGLDSLSDYFEEGAASAKENAAKIRNELTQLVDDALAQEQRFESSVKNSPSFETFFNQARVDEARSAVASRAGGRRSGAGRGGRGATAAANAQQAALEKLQQQADSLTESLRTPWEVATDNLEIYDELLQKNLITQETWARATNEALDSVNEEIGDLPEKAEEIDDAWSKLGETFTSAFGDAIAEGAKFSDVLKSLGEDIAKLLASELSSGGLSENLAGLFGSSGGSTSGGGFSAFLGSLFGGAKAIGGSVESGRFYEVGENGPELFAPGVSGQIIPAGKMPFGGGTNNIGITINGVGNNVSTESATQFATRIAQDLQRQLRRNT